MLTVKGILLSCSLTFMVYLGIPSKIKQETWQSNEFDFFLEKYNKSYENTTIYAQRFVAFKKSLEMIKMFNANRSSKTSALFGITSYSDMYQDEFIESKLQKDYAQRMQHVDIQQLQEMNENGKSARKNSRRRRGRGSIPRKVDWRSRGVISDVNNQYACGACWAFSTIETIESMHAIRTGKLVKLSTQQMIDCAGYRNNGCKGGDICSLLHWLSDNDVQIQTEDEYPLHLQSYEKCKMTSSNATLETNKQPATEPQSQKNNLTNVRVSEFACQTLIDDEDYLLMALAYQGPVAVAVNAITWQNYLGGVIQYHCNPHALLTNHAVQIVGYDLDAEIPHYIVRNSWGGEFGDGGYLYIAVGSNLCGIANQVSALKVT